MELDVVLSGGVFAVFLLNTLALVHYVFLCLRDGVAQAYGPIGSEEFAIFRDERPAAFWAFVAAFVALAVVMAYLAYDALAPLIG